jgi:hypothetical protein
VTFLVDGANALLRFQAIAVTGTGKLTITYYG